MPVPIAFVEHAMFSMLQAGMRQGSPRKLKTACFFSLQDTVVLRLFLSHPS